MEMKLYQFNIIVMDNILISVVPEYIRKNSNEYGLDISYIFNYDESFSLN